MQGALCMCNENNLLAKNYVFSNLKTKKRVWHEKERIGSSQAKDGTPTPWLTLLLVLGKSRVKQNSC